LASILARITAGEGSLEDIKKLEALALTVKQGSLCGLGQTAPNPVLSTLRYFRNEYLAHIVDRTCPARVCKNLITYFIDPGKCVGCLLCLKSCPVKAISGERKKVHVIDQAACIKCGACLNACPAKIQAVMKTTGEEARALVGEIPAGTGP
jgi:ferredoxin